MTWTHKPMDEFVLFTIIIIHFCSIVGTHKHILNAHIESESGSSRNLWWIGTSLISTWATQKGKTKNTFGDKFYQTTRNSDKLFINKGSNLVICPTKVQVKNMLFVFTLMNWGRGGLVVRASRCSSSPTSSPLLSLTSTYSVSQPKHTNSIYGRFSPPLLLLSLPLIFLH